MKFLIYLLQHLNEERSEMTVHCSPMAAFTMSEQFCPSLSPDASLLS